MLIKAGDAAEPEMQNRAFCAVALGYKPNHRSYDMLSRMLRSDASGEVRANAAAGLGYLGDARAVPQLVVALRAETHWSCRTSAAVSLGMLYAVEGVGADERRARPGDEGGGAAATTTTTAAAAAGVMSSLEAHREQVFDALVQNLSSATPHATTTTTAQGADVSNTSGELSVMRACMGALGQMGDARAIAHMLQYASSEDFITRQVLAEALGELLAGRATAVISGNCHNGGGDEEAAEKRVEDMVERARQCLRFLEKDDHRNVRAAAELALQRAARGA